MVRMNIDAIYYILILFWSKHTFNPKNEMQMRRIFNTRYIFTPIYKWSRLKNIIHIHSDSYILIVMNDDDYSVY